MTRYLALLRGINVGGHRIIKMEGLAQMFADMKLKNVSTFIQSGNVLFSAKEPDMQKLGTKIEQHLLKELGYAVGVVLRTTETMQAVLQGNPYASLPDDTIKKYVAFFSAVPDGPKTKTILDLSAAHEQISIEGDHAYLAIQKDSGIKERLTNAFLEKKLGVLSTVRNWATVNKLAMLLQEK